jgi:lipopolysaccharide export system protein LptC
VSTSLKIFLLCFVPVAAALAANTQISADKPIVNFRLPSFTPEGHRAWLVRGSEARFANENLIGIKELTLSVFSGRADEKVETLILSPTAEVRPADAVITGPDTIRVINDQFEAAGRNWRYEHKAKKVSIGRNVRVAFRAEFKDYLK